MTQFHSDDYVDFLSRINPNNVGSYQKEQHKCRNQASCSLQSPSCDPSDNVGDDCPVFDGLFDYCAISAGGSMGTQHGPRPIPFGRFNFTQRAQPDSVAISAILLSIGLVASTTPRRAKQAVSVMSMAGLASKSSDGRTTDLAQILCWVFWNSCVTTQECYTLTSMCITAMASRKLFSRQIV